MLNFIREFSHKSLIILNFIIMGGGGGGGGRPFLRTYVAVRRSAMALAVEIYTLLVGVLKILRSSQCRNSCGVCHSREVRRHSCGSGNLLIYKPAHPVTLAETGCNSEGYILDVAVIVKRF